MPSAHCSLDVHLDWRYRTRVEFAFADLVAALAPSNNPFINPTACKAVIDSGGANIVNGVRSLVADSPPRVLTMVRPDAFEVGADLVVTPGGVVLRTETFELIQYTPQTPTVRTRPLLIVPPVINKNDLADIAPGRSLVEYLMQGGHRCSGSPGAAPTSATATGASTSTGRRCWTLSTGPGRHRHRRRHRAGLLLRRHPAVDRGATRWPGTPWECASLTRQRPGWPLRRSTTPPPAATTASATRGRMDGRTLADVCAWLRPNDGNYRVNNHLQGKDLAPFDTPYPPRSSTRPATPAGPHHASADLAAEPAGWQPATATTPGHSGPATSPVCPRAQRAGSRRAERAGRSPAGAAGTCVRRLRPRPMNGQPARAVRLGATFGRDRVLPDSPGQVVHPVWPAGRLDSVDHPELAQDRAC